MPSSAASKAAARVAAAGSSSRHGAPPTATAPRAAASRMQAAASGVSRSRPSGIGTWCTWTADVAAAVSTASQARNPSGPPTAVCVRT
jgi:hypothetical protein